MKRWFSRAAALGAVLGTLGCHPKTVGDIIHELRSDAYVRRLEVGNHDLEFRLIPETLYYLLFGALDSTRTFSLNLLDSTKMAQKDSYGLMFSMTVAPRLDTLSPTDYRNDVVYGEITGEADYRSTLNGFLSGLSEKIWLEVHGRRYPLRSSLMVNSWGMSKSRQFNLIFSPLKDLGIKKGEEVVLVIDNLVPGQGRDTFHWKWPVSGLDFSRG